MNTPETSVRVARAGDAKLTGSTLKEDDHDDEIRRARGKGRERGSSGTSQGMKCFYQNTST